jgi:hypothetical protein
MVLDARDGAARTNGEASSSSSHSTSGEEHPLPPVLGGFVNGDQPLPRRLLDYATRAGATTWCPRQATENAARRLVAWTREAGAVHALLVVSVSLRFPVRLWLRLEFISLTDS